MKILHVNSEKSWRGGEQQMASLMNILKSQGLHCGLAARKASEASKRMSAEGFETFELNFGGLNLFSSLKLKKIMSRYDIVHTHTANAHTVAYLAAKWGGKTPIVVSKRTDFPVKSRNKFNHESVKSILCVSNKISEITKNSVLNSDRVKTVYSGIDINRFDVPQKDLRDLLGLKKESVIVGNCSALAPHKDYFTFIDVAKRFPELEFVIIGDGPLREELKLYSNGLSNIHFTGFLADISSYLKSLNYFLMTSETEGLGTSLLDAMICRIPIVATNTGGIPEIVIDHKTGLLAEVGAVEQLSNQLKVLLNDHSLTEQLVQNAYLNVSEHFTRENTAKQTLKVYQEVLASLS